MPATELLTFGAAVAELTSWAGGIVEVWIEFADGPSHVAGMHGELRPVSDADTVDAHVGEGYAFSVGDAGWLRLAPCFEDDEGEIVRRVQHVARPPELLFDYGDGIVHVAQSSGGRAS